jgi:hypothetical protein
MLQHQSLPCSNNITYLLIYQHTDCKQVSSTTYFYLKYLISDLLFNMTDGFFYVVLLKQLSVCRLLNLCSVLLQSPLKLFNSVELCFYVNLPFAQTPPTC